MCLGCNPGNPGDFHGQRNLAGDGPWGLQKSQLNNRQSVSNRSLLIVGWWWVESLSGVQLFLILWAVAHQAPLSLRFPRQEYWTGLPFPSPGDLPDPEIDPASPASPALAGGFFTTKSPGKTLGAIYPLLI